MKIEIRKRTDYSGVAYFIYVDDKCATCHFNPEDAEKKYAEIKASNQVPEVWETIKQDEFQSVNN